MAVRGWGGSIATAIGVAAGAGAAQLGLGYGLGIIAWLPAANGASEAAWVASLAWAAWISATSTVAGAICADRLTDISPPSSTPDVDDDQPPGGAALSAALWRVALAVAAAVGALVTVALIAVPARAAERADTFSPQTIAAGYAVIGVVIGLLIAIAALGSRAIAANVIATVGWLWALAVVAVIDGVLGGKGLATAQLGVWQFTDGGYWRNMYLPGAVLALLAALLIGFLAALPAVRRGDRRIGVATSGAIGPLLMALAYFIAAPGLVGIQPAQLSAYLIAPYAVMAGLAGSVLAGTIGVRLPPLEPGGGVGIPAQPAGDRDPADGVDAPLLGEPKPAKPKSRSRSRAKAAPAAAGDGLDEDAYAPARAYAETGAGAAKAGGSGSGREPLWPDDDAKPAEKARKFGRRGRATKVTDSAPDAADG